MLMVVALASGSGRAAIAQATLPGPGSRTSFDALTGDDAAVLVEDGNHGDTIATSVEPHGLSPGQVEAAPWDDSHTYDADFTTMGVPVCGPCRGQGHCDCHDMRGDVCGPNKNCWCRRCGASPLWAVQVDALVLWRNALGSQPLLSGTDGFVALNAGDARTAAAAGPRIGVIRSLGCGRAIEGNYFNVGGIEGIATTGGAVGPYTPIGLADILFTDIEDGQYAARGQIKSAEVNYRWCQGRRVIWLAGFRWVEWNEVGTVTMLPAFDNIQSRVGNDLYGGQFGCRLRFWDLGKWQVTGVGKVGAFGNIAYQGTTALVDGEPFGPINATDDVVAFFGEVGVNSTLWLTHWLGWRAGYNFFWLEGVATAAQQFPLGSFGAGTASINTNGSVFLQGFSTGLEARW